MCLLSKANIPEHKVNPSEPICTEASVETPLYAVGHESFWHGTAFLLTAYHTSEDLLKSKTLSLFEKHTARISRREFQCKMSVSGDAKPLTIIVTVILDFPKEVV